MFGYVRPAVPELRVKEYTLYRAVYCGLCRTMKRCTGCASCFALNYDFVLLSLFRSALRGEDVRVEEKRCPFNPLKKRPAAEFPALEYSAEATALAVYHKLGDDSADGDAGFKTLLLPVGTQLKRRAGKSAQKRDAVSELSFFEEAAARSMKSLREAEKASPSPDEAAELSAEMTAALFEAGFDGSKARIAREFGRHIGKWIYFTDAADDFEKDRKSGCFNPFAAEEALPKERIRTALLLELDAASKALELIDFTDAGVEAVLKNIVYLGMPQTADSVLEGRKLKKI